MQEDSQVQAAASEYDIVMDEISAGALLCKR